MDLDEYKALVAKVLRDSISPTSAKSPISVFENLGTQHASVVIEAMLRSAQTSILINSEKLNRAASLPELLQAFPLRAPQGTVRIIVERRDVFTDPESALCGVQGLVTPDKFEVKLAKGPSQHFLVVDTSLVRMETDHKAMKAMVSFGASALAVHATNLFDL